MDNVKYTRLINDLKNLESAAVAFSGGVDSTFLLRAAKESLGNRVAAVTVVSPYIPAWEVKEAKEIVSKIGVKHIVINVPIIDEIKYNPEDRCYLCKKAVFKKIREAAEREGIQYVIDGTNFDDTKDYRPGLRALQELGIKSPLLENELTKAEIRRLSRELELPTWDKPAYACLLSRIPYNREITEDELNRIEDAEVYLMSKGFKAVRVRSHGDIARIEVPREDRKKFFDVQLMDDVSKKLKSIGFRYVSMDMEGYRTGSLNETIKKGKGQE